MENKRFTTAGRWLIDSAIALVFVIGFLYSGLVKNNGFDLILGIIDVIWLTNSVINHFKAKKGIAIELDDGTLTFKGCCTLHTKDGVQNIGDKVFQWTEIKDVYPSNCTIATKDGRTYGVNDPIGSLESLRVWRTIENYYETSKG